MALLDPSRAWMGDSLCGLVLLKDRNSANGAGCTATDLEGKTDEPKPAAADELIEICKAFHMGDASFGAGQVSLKVRLAFRRRADCFDAKNPTAGFRQPMGVVQNLPFSGYTGARKLPAREGRIFGSKVVQCRRRSASPAHACLG